MPYLVVSKNGSNHTRVEGIFQDEVPAKFYIEKLRRNPSSNKRFFIEHHEFKDWCPEISEFVLSVEN